jgi:hypothetical protein
MGSGDEWLGWFGKRCTGLICAFLRSSMHFAFAVHLLCISRISVWPYDALRFDRDRVITRSLAIRL